MIAIQRYMTKADPAYDSACLFICLCEVVARELFGEKTDFNDSVVTPENLVAIRSRCVANGCLRYADFFVNDNDRCLRTICDYFTTSFIVSNTGPGRKSKYSIDKLKFIYTHFVLTSKANMFDPLGTSNTAVKGHVVERRSYFVK